jgi:RNA polymerase primary sigma factor
VSPSQPRSKHARILELPTVQQLVDRGRVTGSVTADEIRRACESAELPIKESKVVVEHLKKSGVTVTVSSAESKSARKRVVAASARRTSTSTTQAAKGKASKPAKSTKTTKSTTTAKETEVPTATSATKTKSTKAKSTAKPKAEGADAAASGDMVGTLAPVASAEKLKKLDDLEPDAAELAKEADNPPVDFTGV